ncbi:hypothetical protein [Bacillus gaemokensis]|uniref:Uncharacterized protein n=1 Tax=Bacillus gaemokensis TaxID=574375 RepID=A0A073KIU2_9BACI|nr:hypothetical protein [Bacillus gaemokensis]KEK26440.1 hypothetical protein BAGA_04155 [Bacillus gaemokensis]KYG39242.1 hypothetical protein AZF08_04200 [Bacillus gaemokensis]
MARCTNCKTRWKAKDVWSLFFQHDGKDCPYCNQRQYISAKTCNSSGDILGIPFLFLFPFLVELSDKSLLDYIGKEN